jgi:hypothetical protein
VVVFTDVPRGGSATTGLRILDVANPRQAKLVGMFDAPTDGSDQDFGINEQNYPVAVIDGFAIFAGNEALVHVVDVSDPTQPVEVQRIEASAVVTDIDAAARHAYVVSKDGGLVTLRATYPERQVGSVLHMPMTLTRRGR